LPSPLILGSLDKLHAGSVDTHRQRGDDDAPARVTLAAHREPASSKTSEASELAAVDGLGRRHERAGASRLHLDERVAVPVTTDQIDLTEARALIPGYDPKAEPGQLGLSRALSGKAQGTPIHAL
jgi:hypothetical protein